MPTDDVSAAPTVPAIQVPPNPIGKAAAAAAGKSLGEKTIGPASPAVLDALRDSDEAKSPLLPRITMFSDMPDRGLFVAVVTIGFVLIFFAKTILWYAGIEGDYSITIAICAAALMIGYGILAHRITAVRVRPDRLGDNFYYMGFIFTLASMSAALVQLQGGREVDSLIGSFGIALFSTILGIAGRVTFIQMRTEIEDIEERARQDLLEAASKLRGQLGAAIRDLESFRVGVQQTIHERLVENSKKFGEAVDAQVLHIREAVEGTVASVRSAFSAHEQAAESLTQLGNKVSASVDNLVSRIEAINIPPSLLESKIDAMLLKLTETAEAFERVANADTERHKDLAAASTELRRVVTQINNQLSRLQSASEHIRETGGPASEMTESLSRATSALDATAAAAKSLGDTTLAARQASAELTQSIQSYGRMVTDMTEAQKAATVSAAADANAARRRMAQDLEESRTAVAEVQKVLAETAKVVTAAIGNTSSAPGQ